jgi:hypothetical protein
MCAGSSAANVGARSRPLTGRDTLGVSTHGRRLKGSVVDIATRLDALGPPSNPDVNSQYAADEIRSWAKGDRRRVLVAIADAPDGMTTDEIEVALGGRHQSISARVYELHLIDFIVRGGTRKTRSGRRAWVYYLSPLCTDGLRELRKDWA